MNERTPVDHTITITVDESHRALVVDPNPLYIGPGDSVTWQMVEPHPWTVHFTSTSPLTHRRIISYGEPERGTVRNPLAPGKYTYFVAAEVDGLIYTADPELIDENHGTVRG